MSITIRHVLNVLQYIHGFIGLELHGNNLLWEKFYFCKERLLFCKFQSDIFKEEMCPASNSFIVSNRVSPQILELPLKDSVLPVQKIFPYHLLISTQLLVREPFAIPLDFTIVEHTYDFIANFTHKSILRVSCRTALRMSRYSLQPIFLGKSLWGHSKSMSPAIGQTKQ